PARARNFRARGSAGDAASARPMPARPLAGGLSDAGFPLAHVPQRRGRAGTFLTLRDVRKTDDALENSLFVHTHDARDLLLAHELLGVAEVIAGAAGDDLARHELLDGLGQRLAVRNDPYGDVPVRHHAEHPPR